VSGKESQENRLETAHVCRSSRAAKGSLVIFDIVVAVIIVVIAALLGILVHPVLWVIIIAAVLWLFGRSRSRARV
jgi:uncharacterized membrane protein